MLKQSSGKVVSELERSIETCESVSMPLERPFPDYRGAWFQLAMYSSFCLVRQSFTVI